KAVTPAFAPMGIHQDNWPATVGIVSGLLAKEVVVGTLDALYAQMAAPAADVKQDAEAFDLLAGLQAAVATIPTNVAGALGNLGDPLGFGIVNEAQEVSSTTFRAMQQHFDGKVGAFAYLLFILMYFPCVAATSAMIREVGVRWAALGVAWSTFLGYGAAVVFYQAATLSQHPQHSLLWIGLILGIFAATVYSFYRVGGGNGNATGGNPRLPATAR
ncbi:MAG: nucleoside recognition domain-containing protein, partial [Thiothrix sp.]